MKKDTDFSLKSLTDAFAKLETFAASYAVVLFLLLLAVVYGFVLLKITTYTNVQPNNADIAAQVKAANTPHLSPTVVNQMQSLQDHSVSVKTLFDAARTNPFQE